MCVNVLSQQSFEIGGSGSWRKVVKRVGRSRVLCCSCGSGCQQSRDAPSLGITQPGDASKDMCIQRGGLYSRRRTSRVLWLLSTTWMCEGESSCSYVPASNHLVHTECLNVLLKRTSVQNRVERACVRGSRSAAASAGSSQVCTQTESQMKAVNY